MGIHDAGKVSGGKFALQVETLEFMEGSKGVIDRQKQGQIGGGVEKGRDF
jgi:hypothetical protein